MDIYKELSLSMNTADEIEEIIEDMYIQGYELKKLSSSRRALFTSASPQTVKAYVEIGSVPSDEQKNMYSDSGWEYKGSSSYFSVYINPSEEPIPVHTDREIMAETAMQQLKAAKKKLLCETGILLGLTLITALFYIAPFGSYYWVLTHAGSGISFLNLPSTYYFLAVIICDLIIYNSSVNNIVRSFRRIFSMCPDCTSDCYKQLDSVWIKSKTIMLLTAVTIIFSAIFLTAVDKDNEKYPYPLSQGQSFITLADVYEFQNKEGVVNSEIITTENLLLNKHRRCYEVYTGAEALVYSETIVPRFRNISPEEYLNDNASLIDGDAEYTEITGYNLWAYGPNAKMFTSCSNNGIQGYIHSDNGLYCFVVKSEKTPAEIYEIISEGKGI